MYILKFATCLTLFYAFYMLLLSRETFHRLNRITILGIIILSATLPLARLATQAHEPLYLLAADTWELPEAWIDDLPQEASAAVSRSSLWLVAAYAAGALVLLVHYIIATLQLIGIMRSGTRQPGNKGLTLIVTPKPVPPFSWFNRVVIHSSDWEENGRAILAHERAHVTLCHWADIALGSICLALQWFNPIAWLLIRQLRNVHEYEADEQVIKQGIDAKTYQLLLIRKAVGRERFAAVASSLHNSKIKRRIAMMLKNKSNVIARLKYICILPLSALAIAVFARPEVTASLEVISNVSVSEMFAPPTDTIVAQAPQIEMIIEEVAASMEQEIREIAKVETIVEANVNLDFDLATTHSAILAADSVAVTVSAKVDSIIAVRQDIDPQVRNEIRKARTLREKAIKDGVKGRIEYEKWKEEHADEIAEVKKQFEIAKAKAIEAADTARKVFMRHWQSEDVQKHIREIEKTHKEFMKDWQKEYAKQFRRDSINSQRERQDRRRELMDRQRERQDRQRERQGRQREEANKIIEKNENDKETFSEALIPM